MYSFSKNKKKKKKKKKLIKRKINTWRKEIWDMSTSR